MFWHFRLRNFLLLTALFGMVVIVAGLVTGEPAQLVTGPGAVSSPEVPRFLSITRFSPTISVSADAALLMDARTGTVLYGKNEHVRRPPASTTKILTAIVALENGDLNAVVEIPREATRVGGSQIWLEAGERLTLSDLLYGLLLKSGNDAAVAIAYHISGGVEAFCELMNKRAKELGALNTIFSNPNGLPEKTRPHYSSAYDLALMARRGLQIPVFQQMVRTRYEQIPWGEHNWSRSLSNTNRLLWYFSGADGVKTGTTSAAGNCLVASATREGFQLIAVVLHSDNRWQDAAKLLEYGFKNFRPMLVYPPGAVVSAAEVRGGIKKEVGLVLREELAVVVPESRWDDIQVRIYAPEYLAAPFWSGEEVGKVEVLLDDLVLASGVLTTQEPIKRRRFWTRWW